jgi:amino acid transporter
VSSTGSVAALRRSLRATDGLAMVVGIMVGSGIFRTPGVVAALLGRPWLTFVAWALGGLVGLLGALVFAELATRHRARAASTCSRARRSAVARRS